MDFFMTCRCTKSLPKFITIMVVLYDWFCNPFTFTCTCRLFRNISILPTSHIFYMYVSNWSHLVMSSFIVLQCLDASRPWLCYWILHSIYLLGHSVGDDLGTQWVFMCTVAYLAFKMGVYSIQYCFHTRRCKLWCVTCISSTYSTVPGVYIAINPRRPYHNFYIIRADWPTKWQL